MDLVDLLQRQDRIIPYEKSQHEEAIFNLLDSKPMKLPGMDLIYDRRPNFEDLLSIQAQNIQSFVGVKSKQLLGFFSISWGSRYYNGEEKIVSYIGDFRTQHPRQAATLWRQFYPAFISKTRQQGIDYHLTAILKDNKIAIKNLVESGKDLGFHYNFIKTTHMINILGKIPFLGTAKTINILNATVDDEAALIEFLDKENKNKIFGFCFKHSEWNFRKMKWPSFELKNFKLVKSTEGKIIAVCLPWSPSVYKRMIAKNVGFFMKSFLLLLRLFKVNVPQENKAIETLYLTHLTFASDLSRDQKAKILYSFVMDMFRQKILTFHMISYADEEQLAKSHVMKCFFQQDTPVNFYVVRANDQMELKFPEDSQLGFEMALV